MGEIGHNTDKWQTEVVRVMSDDNIGYTFWPYKKIDQSCMNGIQKPEGWDSIVVKYSEADRSTFKNVRDIRPHQEDFRRLMMQYAENAKFNNCQPQKDYIKSMGLKIKQL